MHYLSEHLKTEGGALPIPEWERKVYVGAAAVELSEDQQTFVNAAVELVEVADANASDPAHRMRYLCGDPGSGKTEAVIQLALRVARGHGKVLVRCPTGQLVAGCMERFCDDDRGAITVETIHSGFKIARNADVRTYAPPGRLRRYDAIIMDEASQVDDKVAELFLCGLRELPQKPALIVAADYQQLRQVGRAQHKGTMEHLCERIAKHHLRSNYRTNDEELKTFLGTIRVSQPTKKTPKDFFAGRELTHGSLLEAVRWALHESIRRQHHFVWLCVTHKGVQAVNNAAPLCFKPPITAAMLDAPGFPGDPSVQAGNIILRLEVRLRLSRNLDKPRGFVNGALAIVRYVLSPCAAVVELLSGEYCLLHAVSDGTRSFLPCSYGYATTIRKSQGASLHGIVLCFDHSYPPERGYGYVGASRARSKAGLYHYGRIRNHSGFVLDVWGGAGSGSKIIE